MQPDYTSQLEQIVKALNRPSIPTWLIAIVSAFLGFLASVLSQIFQHWYSEHKARSKMRMIIYSEIGAMYPSLSTFSRIW
jgi:H+/Cl- antiporter ClcA